jgi:hypothetical protein
MWSSKQINLGCILQKLIAKLDWSPCIEWNSKRTPTLITQIKYNFNLNNDFDTHDHQLLFNLDGRSDILWWNMFFITF